jgi:hypothetical protein
MSEISLEVKEAVEVPAESVSLKTVKPKVRRQTIKAERVELSDNIKKFDKMRRNDPFSFNSVSLKRLNDQKVKLTPTAEQMITDPVYNSIGRLMGIDTKKEWNLYYDKIYQISEWAKKKVGGKKDVIAMFLSDQSRKVPSMGARRIDDLYIYSKLHK